MRSDGATLVPGGLEKSPKWESVEMHWHPTGLEVKHHATPRLNVESGSSARRPLMSIDHTHFASSLVVEDDIRHLHDQLGSVDAGQSFSTMTPNAFPSWLLDESSGCLGYRSFALLHNDLVPKWSKWIMVRNDQSHDFIIVVTLSGDPDGVLFGSGFIVHTHRSLYIKSNVMPSV